MRAFRWAKRLLKSERGNIIVIGAASMPMLIGGAALAIDVVQLELWKRQMQRAADSAAIAGAYAYSQNADGSTLESDVLTAVNNDIDEHIDPDPHNPDAAVIDAPQYAMGSWGAKAISSQSCTTRGLTPCFEGAVWVKLSTDRRLPFISLFRSTPITIQTEAVAATVASGTFCMRSLYRGTDAGIVVGGNSKVILKCGMATNSRSSDSVITNGAGSQIEATPVAAVGNLNGNSNNFVGPTTLQPYSAPVTDPLAYLPNPDTTGMDCSQPLDDDINNDGIPNSVGELSGTPGAPKTSCFSSMTVKKEFPAFHDAIIIIKGGDITINANAILNATNTTFIMTGDNGQAGDLKINSSTINITAPTTGLYAGVAFYRDRRAANLDARVAGGASINIQGAMYLPSSDIHFAGNADTNFTCLQMIGLKLEFQGGMGVKNECPSSTASIFKRPVIRLVG